MNDTTAIGFRLLNEFQHDFPLHPQPYAAIASSLGLDEGTVLAAYAEGLASGVISRIGAVFAPNRIGASTLAALRVPPGQLEQIAAIVNQQACVNHNYAREHEWNLWFVVAASDVTQRQAVLDQIARTTGMPLIALPLRDEFHIDLGFDLNGGQKQVLSASAHQTAYVLNADEQALLGALQAGLPLTSRPFAQLAAQLNLSESAILAQLQVWRSSGILKRFGVVVRHHELGYTANAMCVWDVPDAEASDFGQRLAGLPGVTLCYRRDRALPDWPYNLYCMIHGKSRAEVLAQHAAVSASTGLSNYAGTVLFSTQRFKQCGAHYAAPAAQEQAA